MPEALIVIPARLGATRLPDKPLADIAGSPMIVHVWRRAVEAKAGAVVVATDAREVAAAIEREGGMAVMTRADHRSGSDRVCEAAGLADPGGEAETRTYADI
jgi:3-deoxy-manno-octulosonate cytidylyltransferase (CMP-KDO synthetase)